MKTILFDLHGTILENGVYPSPIKQVRYFLGIHMQFSDFVKKFEDIMMVKNYETLKDAFEAVAEGFDVQLTDYQLERLIGMWNKNKLLARPFPESIAVLKELKDRGFKLGLITNCDCFTKEVIAKYQFEKYFDGIFLSCDEGLLKHNPAFFDHVITKLKAQKEDTVMVGDSIESDMHGADAAGIKGILIDRKGTRQYPLTIRSLTEIEEALMEQA